MGDYFQRALVLLLIILSSMTPPSYAETRELKVYNYSLYIDKEVLKIFEQETGIKVIYDEFEAAEEAWAKLSAGGGGYDLIFLAHTYLQLAIERGLVRELDKGKIANIKNLDPRVSRYPVDPENRYSVPYMWGTTGIAYREDCVKDPPKSWREFLSEDYLRKYSGKVTLLSEFTDVVMATMIAMGYDMSDRRTWNDAVMREVTERLRGTKAYLRGFWGASEYVPALIRGEICLAQAWNGDVIVARESDQKIKYVLPADGTYYWMDFMVIPKGARNVEEAHAFINFLLRPDIAARNVKAVFYASAIQRELLLKYAEDTGDEELKALLRDAAVYPGEDVKLIPSPVLDEEMMRLVSRVNIEVQAERGPLTLISMVIAVVLLGVLGYVLYRRIRK
ncbi:MAG: spermidine/putrescine ABC transporter substrate-binding protein [Acidilobaceae archaeon]|nr:spermidine/putrescine ABC transporter substrate-binding protein [Acidilobaceae archaeon]MDW7974019.1 spermidine/putrescine ABC transporter substrate-binding protein [Sulfolobales archaeon]